MIRPGAIKYRCPTHIEIEMTNETMNQIKKQVQGCLDKDNRTPLSADTVWQHWHRLPVIDLSAIRADLDRVIDPAIASHPKELEPKTQT